MSSTSERSISPAIVASAISKSFPGQRGAEVAFKAVSLEIGEGEIVSIIGRSGTGKSTLLRLLGGLLDADEGTVMVGNVPVRDARARKTFGLVPQSAALLPWRTVLENVRITSEVNRGHGRTPLDPLAALEAVGMAGRSHAWPRELSGGMQQRVAMARALATDAPILLLDEPFAALDEATRELLYVYLLDVWGGGRRTVVMVTHNINEAVLLSDRVVVMGGTPGGIIDTVHIAQERPRVEALDGGALASTVQRLRELLRSEV